VKVKSELTQIQGQNGTEMIPSMGLKSMPRKPGFHHSEATRRKMSQSAKGRVFTEEHRKHLSEAHIGVGHTDEWRKAISRKLRGRKQSAQHIEARRQALIGIDYGDAWREKHRQIKKQWWQNMTEQERAVFNRKRMLGRKPSSLERAVWDELQRQNIKFSKQLHIAGYFPDIFIPSRNLVIEVDGRYWHHRNFSAWVKDRVKDKAYLAAGYNVSRIEEAEIKRDITAAVHEALTKPMVTN
jgi:very-short-patch-repair endonuclease